MPPYVNYNLYLISPIGSRFTRCPDFPTDQIINGYHTAEAVTVSKLAHIKYPPTTQSSTTRPNIAWNVLNKVLFDGGTKIIFIL